MAYNSNSGKMVLLDTGSYPGESNYLNETVTWLHSAEDWTTVSTSQIDPLGPLPLRANHGMAFDGSTSSGTSTIVLFGGEGQSESDGVFEDTWTYSNAGVWAKSPTAVSPFGRYRHEMAQLNGVGALMFGGSNVLNFLNETWLYSGGTTGNWTQLTPATSPPVRVDFAMAGSTATTNVLLFGGKGTNACLGDTWMWVGTSTGNWVKQTPAVSPPAMAESCMAYDATNTQYVMFGGRTDDGLLTPQTWIWTGGNGGNWHLVTPANTPPARVGTQMGWDGTQVVLFSGTDGTNLYTDTWGWTGGLTGNWVQK